MVGYTNAGKSSLFNRLTAAGVYVQDQLFATLDPTHRALDIEFVGRAVLVDTVGFISKLPHDLVEAFKSTLQEAVEADLLLEVIDVADPERDLKMREVTAVLEQIGAEAVPRLQVFNKIDLKPEIEPHNEMSEEGVVKAVWISAAKDIGIDLLLEGVASHFQKEHLSMRLTLPPSEGRLRAELYALDAVKEEAFGKNGEFLLDLYVARYRIMRLLKEQPEAAPYFEQYL
ncbi:HflX GTPase family protein [Ignatzschineria indica]|uniref:HflX GTPase family protein n=1 Tax=Ignatzschineria indica TaxID=472583 RepID=UPI0036440723